MNFLQRGFSAVRNLVRRRDDPNLYYRWLQRSAPTGIYITPESALELSVVWGCVLAITNAIASCEWNVFEVNGKDLQWLPNDPVNDLLNLRPNPDMTAISFREAMMFGALTWGNAYAEIVPDGKGRPKELWPLQADCVVPRRRPEKPYKLYYEYHQQDGGTVELEAEQVYHLRGPGISGLMGDNLVARAAKSMGLAAAQERFAATYFGNNTIVGGVLEYPGKLTPAAHKVIQDDWADQYKGIAKSNKPALLEHGLKYTPFTNDADKAQMVESRQFSIEDICRWYCVPPHKVQHLLRSTFNNIEQLGIEFTRDALTPWALRLTQEADFKFFPVRGPKRRSKLDMGWLTHGDAKSRAEAHQFWRLMGVYSVNEIRAMEGKNGIGPVGDMRIVPLNMTTDEAMNNTPADALAKKALPADPEDAGADDNAETGTTDGDAGSAGTEAGGDRSGGAADGDAQNIARDIRILLFATVFERYQARLMNREADLRRGGASDQKTWSHLAAERVRLRPWVMEQVAEAMAVTATPSTDVLLAIDSIDNGTPPRAAAAALIANRKKAS